MATVSLPAKQRVLLPGINWHTYTALLRAFGNAGLMVSAPFRTRGDDSFSVGVSHTSFAPHYLQSERAAGEVTTSHESIIELNYRAAIRGWLTLQPDLQLVLNPHYSGRNAVVLGLEVTLGF